jgi:hypothetical protein
MSWKLICVPAYAHVRICQYNLYAYLYIHAIIHSTIILTSSHNSHIILIYYAYEYENDHAGMRGV